MIGFAANIDAMRQEAFELIKRMNENQVALILRILNNGDACVDAFICSGIKGYEAALRFVEEWEAKTA